MSRPGPGTASITSDRAATGKRPRFSATRTSPKTAIAASSPSPETRRRELGQNPTFQAVQGPVVVQESVTNPTTLPIPHHIALPEFY